MSIENSEQGSNDSVADENERKYRHELIQGEFRRALTESGYELPLETEGIMVLSAPPSLEFKDDERKREGNSENVARLTLGRDILLEIASKKLGKAVQELTQEDLTSGEIPPLVLNGETEQLPTMKTIAVELGIPEKKIVLVDCGKRGLGNTMTQFQKIKERPALNKYHHLTVVTSDYHEPRTARTAAKYLPEEMNFDVIGVPRKNFEEYSVYRKIRNEVKQIVAYSKKGTISKYPKP